MCPNTHRHARLPLLLCLFALISGLTACNTSLPLRHPEIEATRGVVMGGQQPVTASNIQIYAVGTATDGGTSTPLLTSVVTTSDGSGQANANANASNNGNALPAGTFDLPALNCPAGDAQVYISASGGNPGLGTPTDNQQIELLAALGSCQKLLANFQSGAVTFLSINELTTVGAIAALYPYTTGYNSIGSTPAHASALAAAFNVANEYVNFQTGEAPGPALPVGYTASTPDVNDLADVIATCVNSPGGVAGDGSACGNLFTDTTPAATNLAPTDTVGALLDIRLNPTYNVSTIFYLSTSQSPFEPVSANPPPDFTLPIYAPPAAPSFSIPGGSYSSAQSVAMTDSDASATIYYTTDNSSPTTASTIYTSAITVNTGETLQAIAVDHSLTSATTTATYSGTLTLVTPTVTLSSVSSPSGSTTPVTITANESGSAAMASGSVVSFGVTSPATGTFSPATCTIYGGSCSVSFVPTGMLAAANYSNALTATLSASGVYATGSAVSTLTITSIPDFSYTQTYYFANNSAVGPSQEDGTQPEYGNLVQGSDGNFYGTTINGGDSGRGTIFRISSSGVYSQLYAFTEAAIPGTAQTDGGRPTAGLIQGRDGFFYGTTPQGGDSAGRGSIFRISPSGVYSQLYAFTGAAIAGTNQIDGDEPLAGLIQGSDGYFYGLTLDGGANSHGTIFRISPGGTYTQLYAFTGAAIAGTSPAQTDGADPYEASLIQGSDGNFYGVTDRGGTKGYGTVFRISATGAYTQIYAFTKAAIAGTSPAQTDGASPGGGLIQGSDGNFYGSTIGGGAGGHGTLFRITAAGTYTQMYAFTGAAITGTTRTDGANPYSNLVQGSDGNFYGTTENGGAGGYGTVFQISAAGAYTQLYAFTNATLPGTSQSDGQTPFGGLTQGSDGNLYGTTVDGGALGEGTLFTLSPFPIFAAPVSLTVPSNVTHGATFTLSYAVANAGPTAGVPAAGPSTLQSCFATNTAGDTTGWTGFITGSSVAQNVPLTAPSTAGTYTYTLTCGGLESSIATVVVQ